MPVNRSRLKFIKCTSGGFFAGLVLGSRRLGFDYCSYASGIRLPDRTCQIVIASNLPRTWQQRYQRNGYQDIDPTIRHAMHSSRPLLWSDELFAPVRQFRAEGVAAGLAYGWTKSFHDPHGRFGMLTLARQHDAITAAELQDKEPHMLWLAQAAHAGLFRQLQAGNRQQPRIDLSAREVEVFRLAAEGKTAAEIAAILAVSVRTVNFHIGRVMARLGAANKTHAVAQAILLGLLY